MKRNKAKKQGTGWKAGGSPQFAASARKYSPHGSSEEKLSNFLELFGETSRTSTNGPWVQSIANHELSGGCVATNVWFTAVAEVVATSCSFWKT